MSGRGEVEIGRCRKKGKIGERREEKESWRQVRRKTRKENEVVKA